MFLYTKLFIIKCEYIDMLCLQSYKPWLFGKKIFLKLELPDKNHIHSPVVTKIMVFNKYLLTKWIKIIIYREQVYYVLLRTAIMIDHRVKSQAKGQNSWSRALKWGIVHLCNLSGFEDMIKDKICHFSWIFTFSQFSIVIFASFYKNAKFEKLNIS